TALQRNCRQSWNQFLSGASTPAQDFSKTARFKSHRSGEQMARAVASALIANVVGSKHNACREDVTFLAPTPKTKIVHDGSRRTKCIRESRRPKGATMLLMALRQEPSVEFTVHWLIRRSLFDRQERKQ